MKTATNAVEMTGIEKTYTGRNPVTVRSTASILAALGDGRVRGACSFPRAAAQSTLLNIVAGFELADGG